MRRVFSLAFLAMVACTPAPPQVGKSVPFIATSNQDAMPVVPAAIAPAYAASRGAAALAADFAELSFFMESGRALPFFSRFEGPITVAMTGRVPASAGTDLHRLLQRLRSEAGLDISAVGDAGTGGAASVTIEFVPRATLRRMAPTAACFVVPNVSSLAEYRSLRGTASADWSLVRHRRSAAIFVPSDTSPQEVRDCLHEEMAQAMGPLNDLYRLGDSVFNDDNFNTVLTAFDMQILAMYYDPALRSGMTRAEVMQRLPAIAGRFAAGGGGGGFADATPRAWTAAIETALGGSATHGLRIASAERALLLARAQRWQDGRLAFSHYAVGRLFVSKDPERAVRELSAAARLYRGLPGGQIQNAHIDMQLSAMSVATGKPAQAIAFADRAMPVIRRAENASLLATMMLIKAEALDLLGDDAAAAALRLDSQPWARYGFGSEATTRERLREIAVLGAKGRRG